MAGLQAIGTVILARLLTPADFGLVAMVAVLVNFAAVFRQAGLPIATIQKPELTERDASAAFWLNLLISVLLGAGIAASGPVTAHFYGEPRLAGVSLAIGCAFAVQGASFQHLALLQRQLRQARVASTNVASQAAYLTSAAVTAKLGLGYWSLVIGTSAQAAVTLGMALALNPWRPMRCAWSPESRRMVSFAARVLTFDVANYFARNLDNLLIGKTLGPTALGLYSRAYSLFLMPITQVRVPLTQAALPALSRLQHDAARFQRYYLVLVRLLAATTAPLGVMLAWQSEFAIRIALGTHWDGAAPILRWLALAAIVQPSLTTAELALLALGQGRTYVRYGLARSAVFCASFVCGLPWGAAGVAGAYALANYAMLVPSAWYVLRPTPIPAATFLQTLGLPLAVATACSLTYLPAQFLLGTSSSAQVIAGLSYSLTYAALSLAIPSLRNDLLASLRLFRRRGDVAVAHVATSK